MARKITMFSKGEIEQMVRQKAQDLCNKRGCSPGNDWEDWFEAEKLVKQKLKIS